MKRKLVFCSILVASMASCNSQTDREVSSWQLEDGFVPDKTTAVEMAKVIGTRIYGKQILNQAPFDAELDSGVWIVNGTNLKSEGGVLHMEIQKSDGRIIKMIHGK